MVMPNKKINVFISSACGEGKEKYNLMRKQLKTIIENMELAKVYLFEDEEASTLSAGQHYSYELQDSDLCIFLIDNADGVPTGVQAEIDCAKKYKIKSLYYFCDQDSQEQTPLQKSLIGAKFAKSKVIHSFEDFVEHGVQGLIDDIVLIYKNYCRGRLGTLDSSESQDIRSFTLDDSYFKTALVAPKVIIDTSDMCKAYFHKLVINEEKNIEKTNGLDSWCLQFLSILFENKSIKYLNIGLFLKELQKQQAVEHYNTTVKRWDAIQAYFLGDLKTCISSLEDAYEYAVKVKLPDWIVKDILIDLRNQRGYFEESKNAHLINDEVQKEIYESGQALYYPLIDRIHNTLNEKYIENILKEKIKSPYTVSLSHNIEQYTNLLTSSYIVAMFNGSLTHILNIYYQIKLLAFYLCQIFDDWNIRILLLKSSIINYSMKETDGISKVFPEILVKLSDKDANEIISFCNNRVISYQKFIAKLQAYKMVGYFFNDERFTTISEEVFYELDLWFENDNRVNLIGNCLFSCLGGVAVRLEQNMLAEVCCKFIEHNLCRWYNDMFKFIYEHLDINKLSTPMIKRLINNLIYILCDGETKKYTNYLNHVLIKLRKQNRYVTNELNQVVYEQLPEFYNDTYKLETTEDEDQDMPMFFEKFIEEINSRNSTQGKDGLFYGFGNRPHATIRSIIMNSKRIYESKLIDGAFIAASETLLSDKQDIETKCDAIDLIVCLCIKYPEVMIRNNTTIEVLKDQRDIGYESMFTSNLTEVVLRFSSLFLYHCFGEETWLHMIEILPYFQDNISAQIRVCKTIRIFLEDDETMAIDTKLESVFLQHALVWTASDNLDVRFNAIKILFLLLRNPNNASIVTRQLIKSIDIDNLYIKNVILRNSFDNEAVDPATQEYIISKCKLDSNFVVRKICFELISNRSH